VPEFTIEAAAHKKDMPPKEGFKPSQIIALGLGDGTNSHEAEWITSKDTDPASLVGTRISGTLESTQYGLRFKKDRPAFGGAPRQRDPKDTASIVRQHSQHMTLLLLNAKATAGKLTDEDLTPGKLKTLTDFFDDDVAAGVERKHPTPGMVRGLPVRNEPERTGTPEPTTPSAEYPQSVPVGDVPFEAA
jgi:hypothetical protein